MNVNTYKNFNKSHSSVLNWTKSPQMVAQICKDCTFYRDSSEDQANAINKKVFRVIHNLRKKVFLFVCKQIR